MATDAEILAAYRKVISEARHIMALHQRIVILLNAANRDADGLKAAIDHAQKLDPIAINPRVTILSGG
jgi:hypothetical protein